MTKLKRLIVILGGKGGTGKTAFACTLYQRLRSSGIRCTGYDSDIENPVFTAVHATLPDHKVPSFNILSANEIRQFLIQIQKLGDQSPDVVLFDLPGASGKDTREQFDRFKLFKGAGALGYRITIAAVLNLDPFSINSLDAMIDFCKDQVDYVVVKNQIWTREGDTFDLWDRSSTRQKFQKLNGVEIELPMLEPVTFKALRDQSRSFFDADKLNIPDNWIVEGFLEKAHVEMLKGATYLGIPQPSEQKKDETVAKAKTS